MRVVAVMAALSAGPAVRAQDEVPFITTPDAVTLAMLELAGVKPSDRLVDLGSGDGRIVITAAKRFGARGLGVEIVPELVAKSRANAQAAGVADRAEFREGDLFALDLASYSVVTMYLLPQVNLQLRDRLFALAPGTRIVSHDWDLGDWRPDRSLRVEAPDKTIGRDKASTVHLWVVPARLSGWWCGTDVGVLVRQHYQQVGVTMVKRGQTAPVWVFDGRARADGLHDGSDAATAGIVAALAGDVLRFQRVAGVAALGFERTPLTRSGTACG